MHMIKFVTSNEWMLRYATKYDILARILKGSILSLRKYNDRKIRENVYYSIRLINGVSKQTETGRFSDIDEITKCIIMERQCRDLHDVGVSSGITSIELLRKLGAISVNYFISDKYSYCYVYSRFGQTLIFDSDFRLLVVYVGPFFAEHDCRNYFFLSKLIFLFGRYRSVERDQCQKIVLFEDEVVEAINGGDIKHIEYDVLRTKVNSEFDYVRCMNLLNYSYFSAEELQQGIAGVYHSLRKGGIFQVGRTTSDGKNNVSFYVKEDQSFSLVKRVGDGSEIDNLILGAQKFIRDSLVKY